MGKHDGHFWRETTQDEIKYFSFQTRPRMMIMIFVERINCPSQSRECLNIYDTHVTANNSTNNNNVVFFLFQIWFSLVSLFNGISTFVGYLMPKPLSQKNSSGTI